MPRTRAILAERYELGPVLGHGGMARVHRGKDRQLGRPVAVKVLSAPYDRDRAFVERFRREAHAAARLNHPNIVAVYDSGSDDGTHYIVTELVEGETLADLLQREGALAPERAVEIATQVCHALSAAHARGVVHRDVKPGNVMLTADGGVKVVDFGIAHAAGAESVTRTGLVLGSASYLSPEQARGERGDERSDIYALGCVLYQMLTGRPPFVADTPIAALYQHVNEPVVPPSSVRPVPTALEGAVLRCLEKEPSDRFASAAELEAALAAAGTGDPTATMPLPAVAGEPTVPVAAIRAPTGGAPRRRFPWQIAAAAAVALVVVVALAAAFGPTQLRARQQLRDLAGPTERAGATGTSTPLPPPATVDEAYDALVETIDEGESQGLIEERAAEDLRHHAEDVIKAYDEGKVDDVEKKLDEFDKKFVEAVTRGEVLSPVDEMIAAAFQDLVDAIESDPPEPVAEDPEEGDDEGPGGGHGGGPPDNPGKGKGNGGDD